MIAGLGNPGREYAETPHNAGFRAVASIADALRGQWRIEPRFRADVAKVAHGDEAVLLVRPMTYMNDSGDAVGALARYYRIAPADVVVVADDVNLEPGRVRVRAEGGAGGHNGLKSIIAHLGTQAFARVRIGVGKPRSEAQGLVGHVLGRIPADQAAAVADGVDTAARAALCIVSRGVVAAMNQFNAPPPEPEPQPQSVHAAEPSSTL
ncbi:MAG: aminoacyl-tRNA hydrolase [Kiritimatiellia bacterium]|jgi:PTH1 family peptidyl-tRNA hydrolase